MPKPSSKKTRFSRWFTNQAVFFPKKTWRWRPRTRVRVHKPTALLICLILSLNLTIVSGFYLAYRQTILSFRVAPVVTASHDLRPSHPIKVALPEQSLELAVESASIVNGIWETSQTKATHLVTSARPGEASNIVIYGHNYKEIFAPLHQSKIGDSVLLTNEEGDTRQYQITEIVVVTPDQIEVVLPTSEEELTLYTCTGWLDSKRLVIKAEPTKG